MTTKRDIVDALNKGVMKCECEHEEHTIASRRLVCAVARHEHRTDYGSFLVCIACHDAGHMPAKLVDDESPERPETVRSREG